MDRAVFPRRLYRLVADGLQRHCANRFALPSSRISLPDEGHFTVFSFACRPCWRSPLLTFQSFRGVNDRRHLHESRLLSSRMLVLSTRPIFFADLLSPTLHFDSLAAMTTSAARIKSLNRGCTVRAPIECCLGQPPITCGIV